MLCWDSGWALEELLRAALEAPVLEVFRNEGMWHFGIGLSGDGGVGTELGLGDLREFSQFSDSQEAQGSLWKGCS